MPSSIAERILRTIKVKLEGITVAAGYEQTVLQVQRAIGPDAPMDVADNLIPALQIRQGAMGSEPHLRGARECLMEVTIICIAAYDATGEKLADLVADVCKVLHANRRWNDGSADLARRTMIGDPKPHETETDESPVTAVVPLTILFRVDAANPYVLANI